MYQRDAESEVAQLHSRGYHGPAEKKRRLVRGFPHQGFTLYGLEFFFFENSVLDLSTLDFFSKESVSR